MIFKAFSFSPKGSLSCFFLKALVKIIFLSSKKKHKNLSGLGLKA
jgi:hypothetical protein